MSCACDIFYMNCIPTTVCTCIIMTYQISIMILYHSACIKIGVLKILLQAYFEKSHRLDANLQIVWYYAVVTIQKKKKKKVPNEGLEPSTTALRAPRSTD